MFFGWFRRHEMSRRRFLRPSILQCTVKDSYLSWDQAVDLLSVDFVSGKSDVAGDKPEFPFQPGDPQADASLRPMLHASRPVACI